MDEFPGTHGFLGTRASVMLDVVAVLLLVLLPLLGVSIAAARRGAWRTHKRLQLALGVVLLVTVAAFEVELRLLTDWEVRAEPSPLFESAHKWTCPVGILLILHLMFAIPTAGLWGVVLWRAVAKFPSPPQPSSHSVAHRRWGYFTAIETVMTAITGWLFYLTAFVMT